MFDFGVTFHLTDTIVTPDKGAGADRVHRFTQASYQETQRNRGAVTVTLSNFRFSRLQQCV